MSRSLLDVLLHQGSKRLLLDGSMRLWVKAPARGASWSPPLPPRIRKYMSGVRAQPLPCASHFLCLSIRLYVWLSHPFTHPIKIRGAAVEEQCNSSAAAAQQQRNSSAAAVKQWCNSSATVLQQQCNSDDTAVQQRCDSGALVAIWLPWQPASAGKPVGRSSI